MVRKIDITDKAEVQSLSLFLLNDANNLLYVSTEYISLLQNYLRDAFVELWISWDEQSGTILGYFPVMFYINAKYGNVCNSLPFYGSNGGIIVNEKLSLEQKNDVRTELLSEVLKSIMEKKCVASTFITNPLAPDFNKWITTNLNYHLTDERIGQLTPLPNNINESELENALMNLFDDPRPRNIRKAIKENITVYVSYEQEAFDFLYDTHYHNIISINGIPKEKRFFDCVKDTMPKESYRIYIAEKDGKKIGALLLFYFNKTVEYFTPAIVEQHRNLQASSLLIYKAMIEASVNGYEWWNWGGTWLSQGGVYDFKRKWGTKDFPYFYYTTIYDNTLLSYSKEVLLKEYPYFFVAPFGKLENIVEKI